MKRVNCRSIIRGMETKFIDDTKLERVETTSVDKYLKNRWRPKVIRNRINNGKVFNI